LPWDSAVHAALWVDRAFETVKRLVAFPRSGRVVPEAVRDEIREIFLGNYRIIYRVANPGLIEILTVHHGARLLSSDDLAAAGPDPE
jgi:plasmid stabilization system protein ParE